MVWQSDKQENEDSKVVPWKSISFLVSSRGASLRFIVCVGCPHPPLSSPRLESRYLLRACEQYTLQVFQDSAIPFDHRANKLLHLDRLEGDKPSLLRRKAKRNLIEQRLVYYVSAAIRQPCSAYLPCLSLTAIASEYAWNTPRRFVAPMGTTQEAPVFRIRVFSTPLFTTEN